MTVGIFSINNDGYFEFGFPIEVKLPHNQGGFDARLSKNLRIRELHQQWQEEYQKLGRQHRDIVEDESLPNTISPNDRSRSCLEKSENLVEEMNEWLATFREDLSQDHVDNWVNSILNTSIEFRFLIQTDNKDLWKLPWSEWGIFAEKGIEIGISPRYWSGPKTKPTVTRDRIRILAIIGDDSNINPQQDIDGLPLDDTYTIFPLVQPDCTTLIRTIQEDDGWDILFFAGHSTTDVNTGVIRINQNECLKITQLKDCLRIAINRGLKIGFFNSCDGLGIAENLSKLGLPFTIVMRDLIPDSIATDFFRNFLDRYVRNEESLYTSIGKARRSLNPHIPTYPGVTWLPIIFQHPDLEPPTWKDLGDRSPNTPRNEPPVSEQESHRNRSLELLRLRKGYQTLIGREDIIRNICTALNDDSNQIIAIEGIGGVGKTALTSEIAIQMLESRAFYSVIWVSAKPEEFASDGRFSLATASINFDRLLTEIATNLGLLADIEAIPKVEKGKRCNFIIELLKRERWLTDKSQSGSM